MATSCPILSVFKSRRLHKMRKTFKINHPIFPFIRFKVEQKNHLNSPWLGALYIRFNILIPDENGFYSSAVILIILRIYGSHVNEAYPVIFLGLDSSIGFFLRKVFNNDLLHSLTQEYVKSGTEVDIKAGKIKGVSLQNDNVSDISQILFTRLFFKKKT